MPIPLPIWKDQTCEHCYFRVGLFCRRALSSYGYPKAQDEKSGKFMSACSYWHQEGATDGNKTLQGCSDSGSNGRVSKESSGGSA